MKLLDVVLAGLLFGAAHGVVAAENIEKDDYYTPHAQGCMLVGDCTDDVTRVNSSIDLLHAFPDANWDLVEHEFDKIMIAFHKIGVKVFLGPEKYFPIGVRGTYHTVSNTFYLNRSFMHRPGVLMSVVRHEGWHAAQDCMAGSIDNSMIAIIHNEEDVPKIWQEITKNTYKFMPKAIPWEKEAMWAGKTAGMTQKALEACAAGEMWKVYKPTPKTAEWLREKGYIK